ncbi:MAG: hypothetical protein ABIW34_08615, partial [Ginsengibacter sp.]
MRSLLRTLVMPLFAMVFCLLSSFAFGQTVTTDKQDYPPGAVVTITGSGFGNSEQIKLQVLHVGNDSLGSDP